MREQHARWFQAKPGDAAQPDDDQGEERLALVPVGRYGRSRPAYNHARTPTRARSRYRAQDRCNLDCFGSHVGVLLELGQLSLGVVGAAAASARLEDHSLRDVHRAADVTQRLRALYAKGEPKSEQLDLNDVIREVVALSMAEVRGHRIVLALDLADDLPAVAGDRIQLQQVMLNLVRNAIDSVSGLEDSRRRVVIRTGRPGAELLVAVEDSGAGVALADTERIFNAFYSTKAGGMGVGLSICRAIIETHHGKLWATPAVARGGIFQFALPTSPPGALS